MSPHPDTTVEVPTMAMSIFQIETRDGNNWSRDSVGDLNEFATYAEAEAAIESLRGLGEDWAAAEYRVTEASADAAWWSFDLTHTDVSAEDWAAWCDATDPRIDSDGARDGDETLRVFSLSGDDARQYLINQMFPGMGISAGPRFVS